MVLQGMEMCITNISP